VKQPTEFGAKYLSYSANLSL